MQVVEKHGQMKVSECLFRLLRKTNRLLISHTAAVNVRAYACVNIILPVLSFVYETWCLTLRTKYRLRDFENRLLRRIFGHVREELAGDWRKLHNEELHNLRSSPDIIKVIKSSRR
jgi:hypothetical protein